MDRGAWQATVHELAKSGHDWVTEHKSSNDSEAWPYQSQRRVFKAANLIRAAEVEIFRTHWQKEVGSYLNCTWYSDITGMSNKDVPGVGGGEKDS